MRTRAFHEYYGRPKPIAPDKTSISEPNRCDPNSRDDHPSASRRRPRELEAAPPQGRHAPQDTDTSRKAQDEDLVPSETFSDEEDIPTAELEALRTLAANSWEEWPELHSQTIEHNLAETVTYATQFANNAMVGYFTDRPPLLSDFKIWVREELERKSGRSILHTQYLGKNFFLIEFEDQADRDSALDFAPWFYGRKFLYTFPWVSNFDVTTGNFYMLPVWIELPFRSIVLESARFKMAWCLGEILLYVRGNDHSSYPNDKACILWDLREPIPQSIQVKLSKRISIWQPVVLKNVPFTCYHCNEPGHLARDCLQRSPPTEQPPGNRGDDYPDANQNPPQAPAPNNSMPPRVPESAEQPNQTPPQPEVQPNDQSDVNMTLQTQAANLIHPHPKTHPSQPPSALGNPASNSSLNSGQLPEIRPTYASMA